MKIERLEIIITPSFRAEYQELFLKGHINGKTFETQEIFHRDDLHSTLDRMFDNAKQKIKQALEMEEI